MGNFKCKIDERKLYDIANQIKNVYKNITESWTGHSGES